MPGFRLPLELELYILDLAIPPRTSCRALERALERAQLCKTFALVHRDWTARAQQHLVEHVVFRTQGRMSALLERLAQLEAVSKSSCGTRRIDLWLGSADDYEFITSLGTRIRTNKELGLRPLADLLAEPCEALRRFIRPFCPCTNSLPPGLCLFSIANFTLLADDVEHIVRLPHLETLLLTDVEYRKAEDISTTLVKSRVRVLGLKGTHPAQLDYTHLRLVSPTIQHVALFDVSPWTYSDIAEPAERGLLTLPSTLRTLTITLRAFENTAEQNQDCARQTALAAVAALAEIRLKVQRMTEEEMDQLDLEEWALSVDSM